MDGAGLIATGKKPLGKAMVAHSGGNKKLNALSSKVWKRLKEFDFTALKTQTSISTQPQPAEPRFVSELKECSNSDLLYLLEHHIFTKPKHAKLDEHKAQILKYLEEQNIDGQQVSKMRKRAFCDHLVRECDSKRVRGPAGALYKGLTTMDLSQFPIVPMSRANRLNGGSNDQHQMDDVNISKLEDCDAAQIADLMDQYIFVGLANEALSHRKDDIIECIKSLGFSGSKIRNMDKAEFNKEIAAFCGDDQLNGALAKLYKATINFDVAKLRMAGCSADQLMSIIARMLSDEPKVSKLRPHSEQIMAYFRRKRMDGKALCVVNRKEFGRELVEELGNRRLNGPVLALYRNLTKYQKENTKEPKDVLSCDDIANMARKHAVKCFEISHKKFQKNIQKNKVNGKEFVQRLSGSDSEFLGFFSEKICKKKSDKFREWLVKEIKSSKESVDAMEERDVDEFTKFILDAHDEFIAHLFVMDGVNGNHFKDEGGKSIAMKLIRKYGVPRGGITNLCRDIENDVKNEDMPSMKDSKAKPMINLNVNAMTTRKPKKWMIQKSMRCLPSIDLDEKSEDEEDGDADFVEFEWRRKIESVEECTNKELCHVLAKHILPSMKWEDIQINKVLDYVRKIKLDGKQLKQSDGKKSFREGLGRGCDIKRGPGAKLYKEIINFKYHEMPRND